MGSPTDNDLRDGIAGRDNDRADGEAVSQIRSLSSPFPSLTMRRL